MEVLLIVFTIASLFFLKKILFKKKKKKEEVNNKKIEIKVIQKEENVSEVLETKEEKKIILYELNTHPIKLNLYSIDSFSSYQMKNLYEEIIMDLVMIDEPFHTSFFTLLKFIDSNDFWIRSQKTSNIIIHIRDNNLQKSVHESLKVFDIKDIIYKVILELLKYFKYDLQQKRKQILLLSCMVYILAKSENIKIFCENCEGEYEVSKCIVEKILSLYSGVDASEIIPKNNLNYVLIGQLYDIAIKDAIEHNNVLNIDKDSQGNIKLLVNYPKKMLIPINGERNNVIRIVSRV